MFCFLSFLQKKKNNSAAEFCLLVLVYRCVYELRRFCRVRKRIFFASPVLCTRKLGRGEVTPSLGRSKVVYRGPRPQQLLKCVPKFLEGRPLWKGLGKTVYAVGRKTCTVQLNTEESLCCLSFEWLLLNRASKGERRFKIASFLLCTPKWQRCTVYHYHALLPPEIPLQQ